MRVDKLGLKPTTLACLHAAGIYNLTQLTSRPCIELMQHPAIGTAEVHEIIRQLNKRDLMLPTQWGHVRIPNERTLEMFRLRFVEGLSLTETGRRTGVSRSRVYQLLHLHFGISTLKKPKERQHTVSKPR